MSSVAAGFAVAWPAAVALLVVGEVVEAAPAQVVAGGEPSLAAVDHHICVLGQGAVVTAPGANFFRQASAT